MNNQQSTIPLRFATGTIVRNQKSLYQPRPLEIIDSTLRDGQQTSLLHDHHKYFFTRADKEEILRALIIYGVKFVELFAPVVSPQERDDWRALRDVRDSLITQKGYTFLLSHVRCHPRDVESAIEAGTDGLNFYIGTSAESRYYNHGNDLDSVVAKAAPLIEEVRRNYPHLVRLTGSLDGTSILSLSAASTLIGYEPRK